MHTTVSDGVLEPVEAINVYREAGYDFIAISDHRKVGHPWQDDHFLILPGVEWDTGNAMSVPVYHILGIGMDKETADFYHGAPYEGAALGSTKSGVWTGRKGSPRRKFMTYTVSPARRSSTAYRATPLIRAATTPPITGTSGPKEESS